MAPDWLDVGYAKLMLILIFVGLIVAAVLSMKLVRKVVKLLIVLTVIVILAILIASQWVGLQDCRETCSCTLFGQELSVPDNPLCGENRVRIDVNISNS